MVLPFVRDLFADVEKLPAFSRVASHLKEGTGRIRVSGLTPTAKALLLVLLQKAAGRPLIVVVADNRAAEDLVPVLQAFCELTGAADPESVVSLPARDVLPFQNLSPHPEIQEERAVALWKIATGAASIVVSPIAATALRLRSAEYYADLARTVRRGETLDVDALLPHLNTVGYTLHRRRGDARRIRPARRHSRCLLARSRAPGAHRVLRRRGRVHPQVRSRHPALFESRG